MTAHYVKYSTVPKSIPKGRLLIHNHMRHSIDMSCGLNGFRAWTDTKLPSSEFKRCRCGWSGLPHYSVSPNYKCEPLQNFALSSMREETMNDEDQDEKLQRIEELANELDEVVSELGKRPADLFHKPLEQIFAAIKCAREGR